MENKETFSAELAKQIPINEVYTDLAKPAISTIGKTLQGATRVALAPISALIWGYDKIAAYLDVAIPEYFAKRKISQEKIVSPDPSVAGPLIDAMRYTSHKEELREMFTNLLGSAMNSDSNDEHPAFVEIIKQLSSDECRILKTLQHDPKLPIIRLRLNLESGKGEVDIAPYFSDICFKSGCQFPAKFPEYLNNLARLGLVDIYQDRYLTNDEYYEELRSHISFPRIIGADKEKIVEKKSFFELSEFGKKFCNVCIG